MNLMLKKPSAYLPMGMSLAALMTLAVQATFFGLSRQVDEGTATHIWQILMGAQLPIIAYFAIRWLPVNARPALTVLAIQVGLAACALAPVYLLKL